MPGLVVSGLCIGCVKDVFSSGTEFLKVWGGGPSVRGCVPGTCGLWSYGVCRGVWLGCVEDVCVALYKHEGACGGGASRVFPWCV